jgi:hypothetical protein
MARLQATLLVIGVDPVVIKISTKRIIVNTSRADRQTVSVDIIPFVGQWATHSMMTSGHVAKVDELL